MLILIRGEKALKIEKRENTPNTSFLDIKTNFKNYYDQLTALETYVESIEEILLNKHKSHFGEAKNEKEISELILAATYKATLELREEQKKRLEASSAEETETSEEETEETQTPAEETEETETQVEEAKETETLVVEEAEGTQTSSIEETTEEGSTAENFSITEEHISKEYKKLLENKNLAASVDKVKISFSENGNFRITVDDYTYNQGFKDYFEKLDEIRKHIDLLFRSSLISLAVTFELLITNIVHHRSINHPQSIGISGKTLTYSEMEKLGSFEDAKSYIVEDHVSTIMRKSSEDWLFLLKDQFKLEVDNSMKPLEELIHETFQRRNIVVHAGGIVNNIYLTKVPKHLRENLNKGDKIEIEKDYIMGRIKEFKMFGVNLMYKYWRKIEKSAEKRVEVVSDYAYEALEKGEYISSRSLYELIIGEDLPQSDLLRYKINYWQTFKWNNEIEFVKEEIEQLDFSAVTGDFRLCKYLLLEMHDMAFVEFKKIIDAEPEELELMLTWPILKEFTMKEEVVEYISSKGFTVEEVAYDEKK